jgi:L-threonylcarbamoyladenylate synthase
MNEIAQKLISGQVGVLATDTVYGIVGKALDPAVVARIYRIKRRNSSKPFIILISGITELKKFGIQVSADLRDDLNMYWPGPTSIILPCHDEKTAYLHRNTNTLAFRVPDKTDLIKLLQQTGPLVAPSANPESEPPAETIAQARKYFNQDVDFYLDEGKLEGKPSKIIKILGHKIRVVRD